jgi:hypothetical protein
MRGSGTNERPKAPRDHLQRVGKAAVPGCDDTSGSSPSKMAVDVAQIADYNLADVIATYPDGNIYVRDGQRPPSSLASRPWLHWENP